MNNSNIFSLILFYSLIFFVIIYIFVKQLRNYTKKNRNINNMKNEINELKDLMNSQYNSTISSFHTQDAQYKDKCLRDFYVLSSYNSCCSGKFDNDYVDIQSLILVISTGARFLDFEIYELDGVPVVAASSNNSIYSKGTYNYVLLSDVFDTIFTHAFSSGSCPNPNDPLFINLRFKIDNSKISTNFYDLVANYYTSSIPQSKRADMKYNNQFNGQNLFSENINNFNGKAILLCDNINNSNISEKLNECTNAVVDGVFLQTQNNFDIVNTHDSNLIIEHNKKNAMIVLPDLTNSTNNIDFGVMQRFGVQFACMNIQNVDSHLVYTMNTFYQNQSAFILKPENLRYVPVTIDKPLPQNPKLSYAQKVISKPYFTHVI